MVRGDPESIPRHFPKNAGTRLQFKCFSIRRLFSGVPQFVESVSEAAKVKGNSDSCSASWATPKASLMFRAFLILGGQPPRLSRPQILDSPRSSKDQD